MADLLLDHGSRERLSQCLRPFDRIPLVGKERLRDLKMQQTNHVTLEELAAISDALFPMPLVNIVMDADYHVSEAENATS